MLEIWLPVPVCGFSSSYEVSNFGQVRNTKTKHILIPMRTGSKRKGAQRSKVRFSTDPRVDRDVAHLVLEAFVMPCPLDCYAMHIDDDSGNNHINNLMWGTKKENAVDCARKGRAGGQKITREEAMAIFTSRKSGVSGASLARKYGISQQRVCDIFKGRTALL